MPRYSLIPVAFCAGLVAAALFHGGEAWGAEDSCRSPALKVDFEGDSDPQFRRQVLRLLAVEVERFGAETCVDPRQSATLESGNVILRVSKSDAGAHLTLVAHAGRLERQVQFSGSAEDAQALLVTVAAAEALAPNWFVPADEPVKSAEQPRKVRPRPKPVLHHFSLAGRGLAELDGEGEQRFGGAAEFAWWPRPYLMFAIEGGYLKWEETELVLGVARTQGGFLGARMGLALGRGSLRPVLFTGAHWLLIRTEARSQDAQTQSNDFTRGTARFVAGIELGMPLARSLRLSLQGLGGLSTKALEVSDGARSVTISGHPLFSAGVGLSWHL